MSMSEFQSGQHQAMKDLGINVVPSGQGSTFSEGYLSVVKSVIKFRPLTEV